MHALVTTILLGSTGLDPLDANTQAKPPDSKFAQVEQSVCGSERYAVVTADVGWQAPLLKKPLKHNKSVVFSGRRSQSDLSTLLRFRSIFETAAHCRLQQSHIWGREKYLRFFSVSSAISCLNFLMRSVMGRGTTMIFPLGGDQAASSLLFPVAQGLERHDVQGSWRLVLTQGAIGCGEKNRTFFS